MSRADYLNVPEPSAGILPEGQTPMPPPEVVPQAEQAPQEPPSIEQDFYHKPIQTLQSIGLGLKIHLGIAVGVSSLCFLIWHFVTPGDPSTSVWWWIFPAFFFAITLVLHHNLAQKKYFEGVLTALVVLNVMLYFTYKVTAGPHTFPWWVYPPLVTAMVMVPIYFRINKSTEYSGAFMTIWIEYWLLNLLLFITWSATPLGHPWFLYPLIILGTPLMVYRARSHYKETRIPILVGIPLLSLNLCFFIIWGFAHIGWPWFLIPLALTAALEVLLVWRFKTHTHEVIADSPAFPQSPDDSSPTYPPHSGFPPAAGGGDSSAVYNVAAQSYSQPAAYPAPSYPQPTVYISPPSYNQ